jgi:type I restriction enzyme, S subunit
MQLTIANFSEAEANERIDAQFFSPEYADSCYIVAKGAYDNLSNIAHISDGNHLKIADEFDTTDGIRYLRGQDLGSDMMLSDRNVVYIPEALYRELKRSHIFKQDILVTIVGANTGLVGLVYDPPAKLVANCKLGIVRVDTDKILPGYLYAFLISKFGQHQILRSVRGGGQTGLILPDMRKLRITRFKSDFEKAIAGVVLSGHQKIIESKQVFTDTQTLLLSELGLLKWQPKHRLTFVKNYSDAQEGGRIDAEYFQPKYQEIIKAIKSYSGGWDTLGNLASLKKCVEVGSEEYLDEGIPFVRVSNLSPFEISEEKYISDNRYSELSQHQPKQGEILFSKDATPGIAHYLGEEPKKMIPSGGILRLKRKDGRVNDEYLTLVLNSVLTKEQVNRDVGGSVILHWRPDQVKATVIPILPENLQTQIQQKITESLNLRKQSKHLLECAKQAVEIAIEQDEAAAIEWLKQQLK